tara:strand:- start:8958 stop:9452 length:495 start_codon:yes stop_codon:yes gene_type:complete
MNQNITIIVAVAANNVIGKNNDLIWHISEDLKRFKALTSGHAIIMGRKTFESLPKALPNRTNIVVTRNRSYRAEGALVCSSMENALQLVVNDQQPFIIGGGEIYRHALSFANTIELTRVHRDFEGDTFFPEIDSKYWELVWEEPQTKALDNLPYSFLTYQKKKQ